MAGADAYDGVMQLSSPAALFLSLACAFAFGCSSSSGSGPVAGGGATSDAGAAASGSALNCAGLIECGASCAEEDAACSDACLAKGSPTAKAAVDKVVGCVNDNACTDSDCIQANCAAEIDACVAPPSGSGEPLTGATPAGSVPTDLVGKWHSRDDFYEFMADGTVARVTEGKVGGCKSSRLEKGTAVTEGANLTVYFTSSVFTLCDKPGNSAYTPKSEGFTYLVEPSTVGIRLVLASKTCSYTDPAAARFYCSTSYDKE